MEWSSRQHFEEGLYWLHWQHSAMRAGLLSDIWIWWQLEPLLPIHHSPRGHLGKPLLPSKNRWHATGTMFLGQRFQIWNNILQSPNSNILYVRHIVPSIPQRTVKGSQGWHGRIMSLIAEWRTTKEHLTRLMWVGLEKMPRIGLLWDALRVGSLLQTPKQNSLALDSHAAWECIQQYTWKMVNNVWHGWHGKLWKQGLEHDDSQGPHVALLAIWSFSIDLSGLASALLHPFALMGWFNSKQLKLSWVGLLVSNVDIPNTPKNQQSCLGLYLTTSPTSGPM